MKALPEQTAKLAPIEERYSLEGSLTIAKYYVEIFNSFEHSGTNIKGEEITRDLRFLQMAALKLKTASGKALIEYI